MALRRSVLHQVHLDLGARMVEFGGWEMPLSYPSGTLAEHRNCRTGAAAFDVSHLGSISICGIDAFDRIQATFTNDLAAIGPGRAQYTHLLDEVDGSVLDDLIVWWIDPDRFHVLPNAANTARVLSVVGGDDLTADRALIALQGPEARRILAAVCADAALVGPFTVCAVQWKGEEILVAGTGYTGEDGVECNVPAGVAADLWTALVGAGAAPAGLGARDTLRLEAGLPLWGQDLGPGITSLQAGLSWVVAWDKGPFPGRDALRRERAAGPTRHLRGVLVNGRQPPRAANKVMVHGEVVGEVTSGNFSPTLEVGIGLALLAPEVGVGTPVVIESRRGTIAAQVVRLPFVSRPTR